MVAFAILKLSVEGKDGEEGEDSDIQIQIKLESR